MASFYCSKVSQMTVIGYESVAFDFAEIYYEQMENVEQLFNEIKISYPRLFGLYHGSQFIGPYTQDDYLFHNFTKSNAGIGDLQKFYKAIHPQFKTNENAGFISVQQNIDAVCNQLQNNDNAFYTFNFSFLHKDETVAFTKEQFQFDFFYMFFLVTKDKFYVGRIWYD